MEVLVQIFPDRQSEGFVLVQLLERHAAICHVNVVVSAVDKDKKLLQIVADDLLTAKGSIFPFPHINERRRLIKVGEGRFCFFYNGGKTLLFRIMEKENFVFKGLHISAVTIEGDDDNIDGTLTGNSEGMKLVRTVKSQLTGFQQELFVAGSYRQLAFIYIDQFPKGVTLTGEFVIPGQFVVGNVDKLGNGEYRSKFVGLEHHIRNLAAIIGYHTQAL